MSIKIKEKQLLSDNWYKLFKVSYDIQLSENEWQTQIREAYDRGNGAAILLYNPVKGTVILTRQFRLPSFINGNKDGYLIEVCAGMLDEDDAEECIKRETYEETGYKINKVEKIYEAYTSPGAVTEMLHFYIGAYQDSDKIGTGGGLDHEQEDIEVLEMEFDKAYRMIQTGQIKDCKTIMLLQYAKIHDLVR